MYCIRESSPNLVNAPLINLKIRNSLYLVLPYQNWHASYNTAIRRAYKIGN